LGNWLIL